MAETVKISPPWITYARKIKALFDKDPDVTVLYDEDDRTVRLLVNGTDKADALDKLLAHEVFFGNVTLRVTVIPANDSEPSPDTLIRRAFDGNEVVDSFYHSDDPTLAMNQTYVSFKPEVAQFFNDDLSDPNGVTTYLYEELAQDVFDGVGGISFTTANDNAMVWP